jgi:hypothetical protein
VAATLDVSLEEVASAAKVTANLPNGRRIAVKLPAYVEDGQTIRLKGQGDPSPLGGAGDAHVTIRFKRHPRFRVEGRDLHVGRAGAAGRRRSGRQDAGRDAGRQGRGHHPALVEFRPVAANQGQGGCR